MRLARPRSLVLAALLLLGAVATSLPARSLEDRRLPKGYHWGRCLLVVQWQTRISGRCGYSIGKGGEFGINGPRQIYEGIDYPEGRDWIELHSEDYWAHVFKFAGYWDGNGNENIRSLHGGGPSYGPLHRQGACWVSKVARICLWKE